MKELFILCAPFFLVFVSIFLSVSAFHGGFHFAYSSFLKEIKTLDSQVFSGDGRDDIARARTRLELHKFYVAIKDQKPSMIDWFKIGFMGRKP